MNRRDFLGAAALSPVTASFAVKEASVRMMLPAAASLGRVVSGQPLNEIPSRPSTFTDFASFFTEIGEKTCRRQASSVNQIVEMHLPLVTKRRMQVERNFRRLAAEYKESFLTTLARDGVFHWW